MAYRVLLSCRDCTGEDPRGCFDGGTEYLNVNDSEEFETIKAATAAGAAAVRNCGPWEFEVVDADDEVMES